MPAQTIELPNLRAMFIPDPDYILVDIDLERADAQVVAWEAGDEELKQIFREGLDLHTENAKALFRTSTPTKYQRQMAKVSVHAVNYGVKGRTLAANVGITVKEAEDTINRWLSAHPAIRDWHDRVWFELHTTRTIKNAFGYRMPFFDRIEKSLLPEALAWCPQSTVGIVTNRGLERIDRTLPDVQVLLQVHDSLVLQVPRASLPSRLFDIRDAMQVTVPYDDPLIIPNSIDISARSWGHVSPISLPS